MKLSHVLFLALISTFIAFTGCKDNKTDASTETPMTTSTEGANGQDPGTLSTGVSGSTEAHYKCPTAGCTGTGDSQGKCPVCGADLVHNAAFHNQTPGAPGSSPANPVQVNPNNSPAATTAPPAAQNAKGVYHFTCPKGHEGGAAAAGNCAKCGEALTHNQAYHDGEKK